MSNLELNNENVLKALREVRDPDLKKDLVTLGMIKDILIDGKNLRFTVELTTPACPLKEEIKRDCLESIARNLGSDIRTEVEFSSRVTSLRDKNDLLPGVRNIIVVASGKGGVGKSTVAVNTAVALSRTGAKVGLIDADIHGPSIPTMLGLKGQKPGIREVDGKHKIIPVEYGDLKVLSIGFLVDDKQAVVWRGPMVSSALRQFVTEVIWGDLDYMIMDLPPGTGDVHLTIVQSMPVTGALVVTTPQEVALADARKALSMFMLDNINVPVLGIVENMSYFTPPELPDKKYHLFGEGGGKELAATYKVPFLGEIPIQMKIREGGDEGRPSADNGIKVFEEIAQNLARSVAIANEKSKAEKESAVAG